MCTRFDFFKGEITEEMWNSDQYMQTVCIRSFLNKLFQAFHVDPCCINYIKILLVTYGLSCVVRIVKRMRACAVHLCSGFTIIRIHLALSTCQVFLRF